MSEPLVARLRAGGCVFAEDEARLLSEAAADADALTALVDRRLAGTPLEHVLGWAEFCGRRVAVDPGVFVPRRRTELVAVQAVAAGRRPAPVVVDLCTGSGAVATVLAEALPGADVHAADVDPGAVACARRNLAGRGAVHCGDLYAALPQALRGRIDVLTANAPYVPSAAIATMPPEARDSEPAAALDGGPDGLDVQRRVIDGAPAWLAPGGVLLIETSEQQAAATAGAMAAAGMAPRTVRDDALDATVVIGTAPAG